MNTVERLRRMGLAFPHCHTSASDGRFDPDEVVFYAKKADADLVGITDHDNMDGVVDALIAGKRYGIDVLPGQEITSEPGIRPVHILAYGIKKPIKSFLGDEKTVEEIVDQGGVALLAHPDRGSVGNNKRKMEKLIEKGLVGVEVFSGNCKYFPGKNGLNKKIAHLGSSDSHHSWKDLSCSVTFFPGHSKEDFIVALNNGKTIPWFNRPVSIPLFDAMRQSAKSILIHGPRKYWVYRREAYKNIRGKVSRNIFQIPKQIYASKSPPLA